MRSSLVQGILTNGSSAGAQPVVACGEMRYVNSTFAMHDSNDPPGTFFSV